MGNPVIFELPLKGSHFQVGEMIGPQNSTLPCCGQSTMIIKYFTSLTYLLQEIIKINHPIMHSDNTPQDKSKIISILLCLNNNGKRCCLL